MALHNDRGKEGERLAREYLESRGYEILEENWTFGKVEIDLIAWKDRQIIFIEVKTRTGTGFGQPHDFVNEAKQRNLSHAAEEYIFLMEHKGEVRFDIISVLYQNGMPSIDHIEDAFWP